jgi:cell pole-organizing protein PopZ
MTLRWKWKTTERMSETRAQQEPSMEEILASIRRMITEDDPARGRAAPIDAARAQPTPSAAPADDDVLELTEALDDPRPAAPPPSAEAAAAEDDSVVSPASASAALAALARLNAAAPPPAAVHKSQTVDDLVRELLRPMLKEWLDANLPRLVEQAVEREVSRIASGVVRR